MKILIGLVAVYSIAISVLLIIAGQKLSTLDSSKQEYNRIENLIKDVQGSNKEIMNQIGKDELKMDSISTVISRVENSIASIEGSKKFVKKKYNNQIAELSNKSLLELKEIALSE
jgi:protein subunit release factor A